MNNLARVALLAVGAMAAKKYMKQQQSYGTGLQTATADPQGTAAGQELLDAAGRPIHPAGQSPLQSLRSNPNLAWIADPELRAKNLDRLKEVWSQRHQK